MIECPLRLKSKDDKNSTGYDPCHDLYSYYFKKCNIRDNLLKNSKYRYYKNLVDCHIKNIERILTINENNLRK